MDALYRFWSERAPRERLLLGTGLLVLGGALVYLLLIEPAWFGSRRLEPALRSQRTQAAQLEQLLVEARTLRSGAASAGMSAAEARAAVEKSLAAAGLKTTRNAPLGDELQLAFADAPYAQWASWLADIERQTGARAAAVTATAGATPGRADIELTLRLAKR
jgi:general secretion pathway protein M